MFIICEVKRNDLSVYATVCKPNFSKSAISYLQIFWYGGPPYRVLNSTNILLSPFLQNLCKVFSSANPLTESLLMQTPLQSP